MFKGRLAQWGFVAALFAMLFVLAACGGGDSQTADQSQTENNQDMGMKDSGQAKESEEPVEVKPINVAFSGVSVNFMPPLIAEKKGFFKKYGLDVNIININGGTPTLQGLLADQYPIAISSVFETVSSNLNGSDAVLVASFIPFMPHQLISRPEIKTADDLKGKAVGMSKAGSVSDFVLRIAIEQLGLQPEKDVTITSAGGQTSRLAALQSGSIAATVLSPPLSTQVVQQNGYNMLLNLMEKQIPLNHEDVITTESFIKEDPDTLLKFMQGLADGIHFFRTNKEETIQIMADYLSMDPEKDKKVLEGAYDYYNQYMVPKAPLVVKEGIETALKKMKEDEVPGAEDAEPETFYDNQFVQKLVDNGFIEGLYK